MHPLVRITPEAYGVEIALSYATPDNFTGRPVYRPDAGCFLNEDAARLLARAVALAVPQGLRLRVFDAFRPSEAQWVLWDHTPDAGFVADPRRGSPHSMGAAVDVTLIDSATGAALEMGTEFDAFTPLSHHGHTAVSPEASRHRMILMGLMTTAGWDFYRNEWWHYQLFNARANHPVLSDTILGADSMMPSSNM